MQLVTMIATPICVLLFIHPQVTILYILLLLMVSVSLMLIAAYLLYQCQQARRRRVCGNAKCLGLTFVHLIAMVSILGLITGLVILYEMMLLV